MDQEDIIKLARANGLNIRFKNHPIPEDEFRIITEIVKSCISEHAEVVLFSRGSHSVLTDLIILCEKWLNKKFIVFIANRVYLNAFCLSGFSITPIVISSRSAEIHYLLSIGAKNFPLDEGNETELACFKLLSELLLQRKELMWAINVYLQSLRDKTNIPMLRLPFSFRWFEEANEGVLHKDLQLREIEKSYGFVPLYYGILHELGHFFGKQLSSPTLPPQAISDEKILEWLKFAIELEYPELKELILSLVTKELKSNSTNFILGIDHLREELKSDIFALDLLMSKIVDYHEDLDIGNLICEVLIYFNGLKVILRLNEELDLAFKVHKKKEKTLLIDNLEVCYKLISITVRIILVETYFLNALYKALESSTTNAEERYKKAHFLVTECLKAVKQNSDLWITGINAARRRIHSEPEIFQKDFKELIIDYNLNFSTKEILPHTFFDGFDLVAKGYMDYSKLLNEFSEIFYQQDLLSTVNEESRDRLRIGIKKIEEKKLGDLNTRKRLEKKLAEYINIVTVVENSFTSDDPKLALFYNELANILYDLSCFNEALEYYKKASVILEKDVELNNYYLAEVYHHIASTYGMLDQVSEAIRFGEMSLQLQKEINSADDGLPVDISLIYNNLGLCYYYLKDFTKAIEYHQEAISIREKKLKENNPDLAVSFYNISLVYYALQNNDQAISFLERAIAIEEFLKNSDKRKLGMCYETMIKFTKELKKSEEVEFYENKLKLLTDS